MNVSEGQTRGGKRCADSSIAPGASQPSFDATGKSPLNACPKPDNAVERVGLLNAFSHRAWSAAL